MNQKLVQNYTNPSLVLNTFQNLYKQYREKKGFIILSGQLFLALFHHRNVPYVIFVHRYDGPELVRGADPKLIKCKFLEERNIKGQVLQIETPLHTNLFPNVQLQSEASYMMVLVQNKYVNVLFNSIMNQAIEKDNIDIGANFYFANSYQNVVRTYNGIDLSIIDTSIDNSETEYKSQYEGLFTIGQIKDIKQKLIEKYGDVVVSSIKLNPLTTLINETLIQAVNKELDQQMN